MASFKRGMSTLRTRATAIVAACVAVGMLFSVNPTQADSYQDSTYRFKLTSPPQWSVLKPEEVRARTHGAFNIAPGALVFVIDDRDPDQNINIQFTANAQQEAPNNVTAKEFLEKFQPQFRKQLEMQMSDAHVVSVRIHDMAGGVALEGVFTALRGTDSMKLEQILLIVSGKAYTITCTAKELKYSAADQDGFQPTLGSLSFPSY